MTRTTCVSERGPRAPRALASRVPTVLLVHFPRLINRRARAPISLYQDDEDDEDDDEDGSGSDEDVRPARAAAQHVPANPCTNTAPNHARPPRPQDDETGDSDEDDEEGDAEPPRKRAKARGDDSDAGDDDDDDADGEEDSKLAPVDGPADGLDASAILNPGKRLTRAQMAAAAAEAAAAKRAAAPPVKRAMDGDEEGDAIASDFD